MSLLLVSTASGIACEPLNASPETLTFPLRVHQGARYLEDAAGRPFFMQGDAAWSLIAQLTREEADLYLQDRKARGFNTILVNLLEHRFASNAPADIYGDEPFLTAGDYSTPNEAYFQHVDWVLRRACELGFAVLLAPSYAGNDGGPEGWYQEMVENGAEKLRGFGRFLGERYKGFNNIIWLQGGDYNPPDKDLVRALVDGIRERDPQALHTAHGSPGSSALGYWSGEPWLAINTVYTYEPVHEATLEEYSSSEAMPLFLLESSYENEHHTGDYRVRMQAYQAILSGAFGQIYGNNPMWHFSGPGLFDAPTDWRQALDSPGAHSMTVMRKLMSTIKWWLLEPDASNRLLLEGKGSYKERAVAALASDGSFALVYVPASREITLDLARLSGAEVTGRWIDPSDGSVSSASDADLPAVPTTFAPRGENRSGAGDWILEVTAKSTTEQGQ
jgi:hypothetical protein